MAAGIVALALEANPELNWRDVQHITVRTSRPKGNLKVPVTITKVTITTMSNTEPEGRGLVHQRSRQTVLACVRFRAHGCRRYDQVRAWNIGIIYHEN